MIGQSVRVVVLARFHDPLHDTTEGIVSVINRSRSRLKDCSWLISGQPIAYFHHGRSQTGRMP
jgi:hypothetical protein